jgi:hypothetical protein
MGGKRKDKSDESNVYGLRPTETAKVKWRERDAFAVFLMTPKPDREFKTYKEFGEAYNVTPRTLALWRNDPSFMRAVYRQGGMRVSLEWLEPIMDAQYKTATSNTVRPSEQTAAAKFLMGVMEKSMLLDEAIDAAEATPVEKMTMKELEASMTEYIDLMRDRLDVAG